MVFLQKQFYPLCIIFQMTMNTTAPEVQLLYDLCETTFSNSGLSSSTSSQSIQILCSLLGIFHYLPFLYFYYESFVNTMFVSILHLGFAWFDVLGKGFDWLGKWNWKKIGILWMFEPLMGLLIYFSSKLDLLKLIWSLKMWVVNWWNYCLDYTLGEENNIGIWTLVIEVSTT